jgi:ADP-ribose diphosphatase
VSDPLVINNVEIIGKTPGDPLDKQSFLELFRLKVINYYKDGTKSPTYRYDAVLRRSLDAVVVSLTARREGVTWICLRSCVRPPILLRSGLDLPQPDETVFKTLWELPAGLIEDDDIGVDGLKRRSAAEAFEEAGYRIDPENFEVFGGAPFVSPGVIPERLFYLHAQVEDVNEREIPPGDGSPVEDGAVIWWVPLDEALAMCERGEIVDLKTELGVRRMLARRDGQEK